MKHFYLLLLLLFIKSHCFSQTLHVNENNGNSTEYSVETIAKITFSQTDVLVHISDGSIVSVPFSNFKNYRYNQGTLSTENFLDQVNELDLKISPNPTNGDIQIDFKPSGFADYSYEIFNLNGKKIIDKKLNQLNNIHREHISLKSLSAGTYIIVLKNESLSINKKIIKL